MKVPAHVSGTADGNFLGHQRLISDGGRLQHDFWVSKHPDMTPGCAIRESAV